jgi:3-phosphoshikimate 1-carboxyvinyltransferase
MKKTIRPGPVKGTAPAPASKSMAQRAAAIAALTRGETDILNFSACRDSATALAVSKDLGAEVRISGDRVTVRGGFNPRRRLIHCRESGLCMRMFSAVAALWDKEITLDGLPQLRKRPISMAEAPLRRLGVRVQSAGGFPPLKLRGPLRGGEAHVDGSVTSQFLTGLLIAAPLASGDSKITVSNLKSAPYVEMTLEIIRAFGVKVRRKGDRFLIPGNQAYRPRKYRLEGDWSAASFFLVAGALAGDVSVTGVSADSSQADRAILSLLEAAGADIQRIPDGFRALKGDLRPFEFDASHCPDLFPPAAALAVHCPGESRIKGAGRLIFKESRRGQALETELGKLGARIRTDQDVMVIEGGGLGGGDAFSRGDHRIAMSLSVAALAARGPSAIEGAQCVAKSHPNFYADLDRIMEGKK